MPDTIPAIGRAFTPGASALPFEAAFEAGAHPAALLTVEGIILAANRSLRELAGVPAAARRHLASLPWQDGARVRRAVAEAVAEAGAGRPARLEAVLAPPGGKKTCLEFALVPVPDGHGGVARLLLEGRDVSECRELEAALAREQAEAGARFDELEQVYRDVPVGLCLVDREYRFVRINARLAAIDGLPAEAHRGRPVREVLPDLADTLIPLYRRVLDTGEPLPRIPVSAPLPGSASSGVFHWLVDLFPARDRDGRVHGILVAVQDVTELVAMRQAVEVQKSLLESQKRDLDEAQRIAGLGSWEWEPGAEVLTWSLGLYRLAGRDPQLPPPAFRDRQRYYTPEGWFNLRQATSLAAHTGTPYALELEFIREDGSRIWVLAKGEAESNSRGQITRLHGTLQDITERRRLEGLRLETMRREADLSRRLVAVQEEERRRLAGMVHDVVSPNVAALKINLGIIQARLPLRLAQDLSGSLEDTRGLLDDTHASLRELCSELRPASLDYGGLVSAVENYAEGFSRRTGTAVDLDIRSGEERLPPDVESLLFRIVQEGLTNCIKHAQARRVRISLEHDARNASLTLADDGIGFDPGSLGQGDHKPGIGLLTMRERAEFAGGSLSIDSLPGQGTRITVRI